MARYSTINACDATTSWSLDTNGVGTGSIDTSIKEEGTGSLKFVRTINKSRNFTQALRYTMSSALDIKTKMLVFKYRWDTPQNKMQVRFLTSAGVATGSTIVSIDVDAHEWHTARVPFIGVVGMNDINRIEFLNDGDQYTSWKDGQTVTMWLDDIKFELPSRRPPFKPFVVFEFDDGFEDTYTEAFPLFEQYGHVATLAMITNSIGGHYPNEESIPMLTSAMLTEMHDAGWEMASHTMNHTHMGNSSESTIISEMKGSKDALQALGFEIRSFVYPFTGHDAESEAICERIYTYASNGTPPRQNLRPGETYTITPTSDVAYGRTDQRILTRQAVGPSITAANVKEWIDDAMRYSTLLIINFHEVNDAETGISNAEWTPAKLEEVLKYLNEKGIRTLTTTQAMQELGYI